MQKIIDLMEGALSLAKKLNREVDHFLIPIGLESSFDHQADYRVIVEVHEDEFVPHLHGIPVLIKYNDWDDSSFYCVFKEKTGGEMQSLKISVVPYAQD